MSAGGLVGLSFVIADGGIRVSSCFEINLIAKKSKTSDD